MLQSWFLFHVASGQAFFSGTALILAAVALSAGAATGWRRRLRNACVLFGALLVVLSATPLPWWAYGGLAVVSALWLETERRTRRMDAAQARNRIVAVRLAAAAVWLVAAAIEFTWHLAPRVPWIEQPAIAILGDSVTAGIGEDEAVTWPRRLTAESGVPVHDYSQMGATVASGHRQAESLQAKHNLVLLALGGNDLLGSTTPSEFAAGLDGLLFDVGRPGRTVVMFELPLPPFHNDWGRIQRRLARQHGVLLIPKRVLMSVLCRDDTTLDSIHLSDAGHASLAAAVWSILRGARE